MNVLIRLINSQKVVQEPILSALMGGVLTDAAYTRFIKKEPFDNSY